MSELTIRFESPELRLRVLEADSPSRTDIRGWDVSEQFSPDTYTRGDNRYGSYRLVIEHPVLHTDNVLQLNEQGVQLINDLELVWAFATGLPLRSAGFDIFLTDITPPTGWKTNICEVDRALQAVRQGVTADAGLSHSLHWRTGARFPLGIAVKALAAYEATDPVTAALIRFHYEAHMSGTSDGPYFLFAKALEIVRGLLPGRTDGHKEKAFDEQVRRTLHKDLHWLFGIANSRLETRHPIEKRAGTLHPAITPEESFAFLRDCDTLIRATVCRRLDLEMILMRYGSHAGEAA